MKRVTIRRQVTFDCIILSISYTDNIETVLLTNLVFGKIDGVIERSTYMYARGKLLRIEFRMFIYTDVFCFDDPQILLARCGCAYEIDS